MTELEKVIAKIERVVDEANPWKESPPVRCDIPYPLLIDALTLLKAQEPIPPVKDGEGCLICGNQTLGCGVVGHYDVETGEVTDKIDNYCAFCGRKVRW